VPPGRNACARDRTRCARTVALARALTVVLSAVALHAAPQPARADAPLAAPAPQAGCVVGSHYRLVALPLRPEAINEAGEVLGTTSQHRAAIWDRRSGIHDLPVPTGFTHSEGISINAQAHAVALAFDSGFLHSQGYFVAGSRVILLGGDKARPYGLNDHDVIAGEAVLTGRTRSEPVLWKAAADARAAPRSASGALAPYPLGACCGGAAKGLDDQGAAIGDAYDQYDHYYAFEWHGRGGIVRIESVHPFSSPVAVNRLGHAVIDTFPGVSLYSPAGLTTLALPRRPAPNPRALNDCDVIVGGIGPFSDKSRAFAWDRTDGFVDLNRRISASAGWKLETATAINDRGEIVGHGDPPGGNDEGFMLLPDPAGGP
jgi:hypothetical protein